MYPIDVPKLNDPATLRLPAAGWAWEWLRRSQAYNDYFERFGASQEQALPKIRRPFVIQAPANAPDAKWGLKYAGDPQRSYAQNPALWNPDIDPSILSVSAFPSSNSVATSLDVGRLNVDTTILKEKSGREHVLFSSGFRSLQVFVTHGTLLEGPVHLALDVGEPLTSTKAASLNRLVALQALRDLPSSLFPEMPGARRLLLSLTALDLQRAGLSQPQIARHIYKDEHASEALSVGISRWPLSRVARLLDTADQMLAGKYKQLFTIAAQERAPIK